MGGASVRGDIKDASVAKQPGIPPTSTSTTDIKLPEPKRKKPTQIWPHPLLFHHKNKSSTSIYRYKVDIQ